MSEADMRPQDVLHWLREQRDLYARLDAMSVRQRCMVAAEDARPLLRLLAERESVTTELERIGRRLAPVRRRWQEYRAQFDAAQSAEAEGLVEASAALLSGVIARDEEDARRLSVRKRGLAAEASAVAASRTMLSGYGAAHGGERTVGSWQG